MSGGGAGTAAPELIQMLHTIYAPEWQIIQETMIVGDISSFADQIIGLSSKHESPALASWGQSLMTACLEFDFREIQGILSSFPDLLQSLGGEDYA